MVGKGTLITNMGEVYKGDFRNSKRNGYGKTT